MPYVRNDGVAIHYMTEGQGRPLVLQHGTTGSWEDWAEFGYTQGLRDSYRLVLVDARGHGASDKPHDPNAYDLALRSGDVVSVLDDLGIRQAHYFGYSLGGWIGFGLARYAPERVSSLILGGTHAYAEDMQPFRDVMPRDIHAFMASMEKIYGAALSPALRERLRSNDLEALSIMTQDRPSLAGILPSIIVPCLLFAGEADPRFEKARECARSIPNATFFSLPGRDHVGTLVSSSEVLPHVKEFLAASSEGRDVAC
jgi:pimeloyl-ACP methyl ester carboxylesterase